jgi:hypothetical protein
MEFCCPSAWSCLSAYMEYEVSAVNAQEKVSRVVPRRRTDRCAALKR